MPQLGLNTGFSIPLGTSTFVSFQESGSLDNPEVGSPGEIVVPYGDTVSLRFEDNRGNVLAYLFQRAPDRTPAEGRPHYGEILLDASAGSYNRSLYDDFRTIPEFSGIGASIRQIVFEVDEHGWAVLDNLVIGPPPGNTGGVTVVASDPQAAEPGGGHGDVHHYAKHVSRGPTDGPLHCGRHRGLGGGLPVPADFRDNTGRPALDYHHHCACRRSLP